MIYKTIDCPKCQGEGSIETLAGSYFDSSQECYYPLEEIAECSKCFGCGSIEIPVLNEAEVVSLRKDNISQVEGFNLNEIIILSDEQKSAA